MERGLVGDATPGRTGSADEHPLGARFTGVGVVRAHELPQAGRGPVLAVAPTANWRGKEWRQERFADLVRRLTQSDGACAGHRVAVLGGPGEQERAAPVIAALPADRVIDLVGRTDPALAAACLGQARLFVGLDSGLTHLAAAAGVPTLALFGPGWPARYRPWGERTAVVSTPQSVEEMMAQPGYDHRTTDTLMDGLTVDQVVEAAERLAQTAAAAPMQEISHG